MESKSKLAFRRTEPTHPQMQSSSSSQFQHDFDLKTLESSFGNLSFTADSSVRQNGNSLNHNQQPINGGGGGAVSARGGGGGGGDSGGGFMFPPPPRSLEWLRMCELSYDQNDSINVNGSYGYDNGGFYNNGFLNGNSRDVSYLTRNRNPWEGMNFLGYDSWRSGNYGGFGYNQDPSSSYMENERRSLLFCAKDRLLCQQLKKRIAESSKETFDLIFNDLIVHVCDLMVDPFGHDLWFHIMPKCSKEQITMIVDMITHQQLQFINICFDSLGTRVIQFLLACIRKISEDLSIRILAIIRTIALQLSKSNNGKHVVVACFKVFSLRQYRNLLEVIAQNCYQIAMDQNGCCLLQQALQVESDDLKELKDKKVQNLLTERDNLRMQALEIEVDQLRQRLIREIIANALKLGLHCYGNYVVQFIAELDHRNMIEVLVRQLVGSYGYLARNKYGSHVVQKFLKIRNFDTRVIVHDLLRDIDALLLDPFGNYVIQTAWAVSKDDVRGVLRWHIDNNIRLMRCSKYGIKILEKLHL